VKEQRRTLVPNDDTVSFSFARRRSAVAASVFLTTLSLFFPIAAPSAECNGDECQGPVSIPDDPTPGTAVFEGPPNPPVHYPKVRCPRGKRHVVHHGASECVKIKPPHHHRGGRR
jgi:hypothetical protein